MNPKCYKSAIVPLVICNDSLIALVASHGRSNTASQRINRLFSILPGCWSMGSGWSAQWEFTCLLHCRGEAAQGKKTLFRYLNLYRDMERKSIIPMDRDCSASSVLGKVGNNKEVSDFRDIKPAHGLRIQEKTYQ